MIDKRYCLEIVRKGFDNGFRIWGTRQELAVYLEQFRNNEFIDGRPVYLKGHTGEVNRRRFVEIVLDASEIVGMILVEEE